MSRIAEASLVDLVRWTGAAGAALLVLGPAAMVATGTSAPLGGSPLAFLLLAFGPGAVAAAAAGVGYLRLPPGDRSRAWPALAAVVLAFLLPLGVLVSSTWAWPA